MSRSFFSLLFACCLSTLLCHAQEKSARTCRVLFLGAPQESVRSIFLHDGTQARQVELPRMNLSPVYPLPNGAITLRLLTQAPVAETPLPTGAPQIAVEETVTDFYLLVSDDPENKVTPFRMQVINANQGTFAKGQMLWYNLSNNRVGGQLGTQKLAMEPKSRVILDAPAKGHDDFNVNLNFYIPGNDRLYPLCETKWSYDPKSRSIYFIVNQPGDRTPRVMGFLDYRHEEKPE